MAQATPTALNHDESYYQRSGENVYPGLAKQVKAVETDFYPDIFAGA